MKSLCQTNNKKMYLVEHLEHLNNKNLHLNSFNLKKKKLKFQALFLGRNILNY